MRLALLAAQQRRWLIGLLFWTKDRRREEREVLQRACKPHGRGGAGEDCRERGEWSVGGGSSGTNNEFSSGVIVNFIGEVKVTSPAYLSSIQTAIKAFNVNVVLVVDHPRLFNKLAPIVGSSATVVKGERAS